VNGAEAFKQTVQLNAQGMGGAQVIPTINVGLFSEITWIATVNGVSSNSVKTLYNQVITPTPTINPYATPTSTAYPSSTPVNHVDPPVNPEVNTEVAAVGAISSIVWALALAYYRLRK
jgi:hypothetical protein